MALVITQTPLRISLVGGGTDFTNFAQRKGGAILGSSINKYVYVLINRRFENDIRVSYTQTEIVPTASQVRHDLVREALTLVKVNHGVEIVTVADVPATGTGLGSSSSLTVGLLNALHQANGALVSTTTLAEQACQIEIDILKRPIGKQDQYLAALGGLRRIEFHPNGDITTKKLPIEQSTWDGLSSNLLLFYTGISRNADFLLRKQSQNMDRNLDTLIMMKEMVDELEVELLSGNIEAVGNTLHKAWTAKTKLAEGITNGPTEDAYRIARKAGATGGKLSGAGGGGFLLLYVPPEKQMQVRDALSKMQELPFQLESEGTSTIVNVKKT